MRSSVIAATAVVASLSCAGLASAATPWAIEKTPNPTGSLESFLDGTSCPSATMCLAVGNYETHSDNTLGVVEHWNGRKWSIQAVPPPPGGSQVSLYAVSCTSPTSCTAVGSYVVDRSLKTATLVDYWNGSAWTIQASPDPSSVSELDGVSCPSATSCTAVGSYGNPSSATVENFLAEHWNGRTWTQQVDRGRAGSSYDNLTAVSCTSSTSCMAVGDFQNSSGNALTLAEHWNGSTWTIQPTPNPKGQGAAPYFGGVSCTSSTSCIAVGSYFGSNLDSFTLAEHWNGATWAIQPTPRSSPSMDLSAVSCSSARSCIAAGAYQNSVNVEFTLVEEWDGSTWMRQATPNPAGSTPELVAVSCPVATSCTAVGNYYGDLADTYVTLAEHN